MNFKLKTIIPLTFLLISPILLLSQKNSHHPYSRFGIGEISNQGFTQSQSLGGISAGLRINNKINYQNPASYTSQDTNSFVFDVGLKSAQNRFSTENNSVVKSETGFDHMAIGFPLNKKWKASIGIAPFSNVGYHTKTTSQNTSLERYGEYEGKGGIKKFYIGNAYEVIPNLSLGFNYYYLFGTLEHNTNINWEKDQVYSHSNFEMQKKQIIRSHVFNLGVQYQPNIFKNHTLTLGASYELSPGFKLEKEASYNSNFDAYSTTLVDKHMTFPSNLLLGFSLSNDKILWGTDLNYTQWSNLSGFNNITDSYSIHTGFQYIPDKEALKSYLKKINYRVGGFYKKGYYKINNTKIKDYGITFGLGLPLNYRKTNFNISCKLGRKGDLDNGLIQKEYAVISFSVTFFDFWFMQRKYH